MTIFPAQVIGVTPRSFAARCGMRAGDSLLTINQHHLRDVIDVQVYSGEPELNLEYTRAGALLACTKKRRYGEPLGLDFSAILFNENTRVCRNNCEFCFVTQMAPGLRSPLYIKDDDYRLSFLHGNYVTLTNLREEDWDRIEEQFLSPLYVSVHVTDPDVRVSLMHNPRAAKILAHLRRLKDMGIQMHTQAVLVPGRNDGQYLDKTIEDLVKLYPAVVDLSVVPVGLTRWHNPALRTYNRAEASTVLEQVTRWRAHNSEQLGVNFVYPADEWFLQAGVTPPEMEAYDGQIPVLAENGVGMVRRFMDSWPSLKTTLKGVGGRSQTWVTGTLFAQILSQYAKQFANETGIAVNVLPVTNHAFGETVTVAGLLTVGDIVYSLRNSAFGEYVILPDEIFRGPESEALDGQQASVIRDVTGRSVCLTEFKKDRWSVKAV